MTSLGGDEAFLQDVGDKGIAQVPPFLHDIGNLRVMPGFALVGAVVADMTAEDTELCPANIDIVLYNAVHEVRQGVEPRHVMAPESKARESEMEPAF